MQVLIYPYPSLSVVISYDVPMPKDLKRYQQTGDLHFVTFSCYQRSPLLGTPHTRDIFERSLEAMRLRYDFFLTGYVVMPEHVHLLISEPEKTILSKALQALKLSVATQMKAGRFWQERYYDFNVYTERKRIEKLQYMHRNPVKRALAASPEQWKWSSFGHYWTGEPGVVEIESIYTAQRRDRAAMKTQVSEARPGAPASVARL
ncbi:MAG: transposase [Acidobacteriaceae bacterium]|nr:transposase [Acidobacteriaceae bacterium]